MNIASVLRNRRQASRDNAEDEEEDLLEAEDLPDSPELLHVVAQLRALSQTDEWNELHRSLFVLAFKYVERYEKTVTARNLRRDAATALRKSTATDFISRLRRLLDEPRSSVAARLVAVASLGCNLAAAAAFMLETVPRFSSDVHPAMDGVWFAVEACFAGVFTTELLLRLVASGPSPRFLRSPMAWVDLLSCLPFYLELIFARAGTLRGVRVLRLARVFRVVKITRVSGAATRILRDMARTTAPALLLPVTFLLAALAFCAGVMYVIEKGSYDPTRADFFINDSDCEWRPDYLWGRTDCPSVRSRFISIPDALWWAVQTVLAVGYGDVVPWTWVGRLFNASCMMFGLIFWSVPLTIAGNNFYRAIMAYVDRRREQQLAGLRRVGRLAMDHDGGISFLVLEKQLSDTARLCRRALPVFEIALPKLYRHVSVCLEQFADLRSRVPDDILIERVRKHNDTVRRRGGGGISAALASRRGSLFGAAAPAEPLAPAEDPVGLQPPVQLVHQPAGSPTLKTRLGTFRFPLTQPQPEQQAGGPAKQWSSALSPRRSALRKGGDPQSPTFASAFETLDLPSLHEDEGDAPPPPPQPVGRSVSSATAPRQLRSASITRTWGGAPLPGTDERVRKFQRRRPAPLSGARSRSASSAAEDRPSAPPVAPSPTESLSEAADPAPTPADPYLSAMPGPGGVDRSPLLAATAARGASPPLAYERSPALPPAPPATARRAASLLPVVPPADVTSPNAGHPGPAATAAPAPTAAARTRAAAVPRTGRPRRLRKRSDPPVAAAADGNSGSSSSTQTPTERPAVWASRGGSARTAAVQPPAPGPGSPLRGVAPRRRSSLQRKAGTPVDTNFLSAPRAGGARARTQGKPPRS